MKSKLIIIAVVVITSFLNISCRELPNSPYEIILTTNGSYFNGEKMYTSLSVFLNNNTDDVLYYTGAECYNQLFSLKPNPYFHLATDVCKNNRYTKMALPPHRSQKMEIFLTMAKEPDTTVALAITMKLYKWGDDENDLKKDHLLSGKLTDTVALHYDAKHTPYWPAEEFPLIEKKRNRILLNKDIYQLTDNDRKLYPLTIDKKHITQPHDTVVYVFKNHKPVKLKVKVTNVPVSVHNNSNETLKFYSMSCSWYEFWATNQSDIKLADWECSKNSPEEIAIAPQQEYKRTLDIIYDLNVKSGTEYQISMSLLKVPDIVDWTSLYAWYNRPYEYVRFNKIWSDKITIQ